MIKVFPNIQIASTSRKIVSEIQNLKDDIKALHKEIHSLKRQKWLMAENHELEIIELNQRLKAHELALK